MFENEIDVLGNNLGKILNLESRGDQLRGEGATTDRSVISKSLKYKHIYENDYMHYAVVRRRTNYGCNQKWQRQTAK